MCAYMQESGNALLKQGRKLGRKLLIKQAVAKYTEGLSLLHASDTAGTAPKNPAAAKAVRTALYSNRAFAESLLCNWRNALESARWAIKTDASHFKSHYRAAQAAAQLKQWPLALELCKRGLALDAAAPELTDIQEVRFARPIV